MSALLDLASWVLLVAGGLACAVGGLGMLRMPDFYTRIHAACVSDAVGAGLVLGGLLLQAGSVLVALKLVVVGLLIFFTSPAATHALARAALHRGLEPWKP
jgi:multicomponent Na+:H+ antiporter subunit G